MNRRDFISTTALASAAATAGAAAASHAETVETRAWEIGEKGGFSTMRLVTRRLSPGPGQAIVDTRWCSTRKAVAAWWLPSIAMT